MGVVVLELHGATVCSLRSGMTFIRCVFWRRSVYKFLNIAKLANMLFKLH